MLLHWRRSIFGDKCCYSYTHSTEWPHGSFMNASNRLENFGVPKPVTGSHPVTASNPGVLQPGLLPLVIYPHSCQRVSWPALILEDKNKKKS